MKRIVVIGPESTGKSTLCKQLAEQYRTAWCPEYARQFLTQNGTKYSYEDLTLIAKGQLGLEKETEAEAKNGFYFIDTDMYVMKVWHEVVFGACPTWVLKIIAKTHYDLYLLCNTDLPWAQDELREYPDITTRQRLFLTYKDLVINSGIPWAIVSGTNERRLHTAINAIENFTNKSNPA